MKKNINNISPIDGRYSKLTLELKNYFSEAALIKYRVYIEIEYFIYLCQIGLPELKNISKKDLNNILKITSEITEKDIIQIKKIESITNHDVKAVEYFIKRKFKKLHLDKYQEFIHFRIP